MKIIAYSLEDKAGCNIVRQISEEFRPMLYSFPHSLLFLEKWKYAIPDLCIVASRHSSKSGKPTLTAHVPGNFGHAKMGGKERELSLAPALYLAQALKKL